MTKFRDGRQSAPTAGAKVSTTGSRSPRTSASVASLPRLRDQKVTEKEWAGTFHETAVLFGWRDYHTYNSRRSEPGFPDHVLVRAERMVIAELKTEEGELSPAQEWWINALQKVAAASNGALEVYLFRPSQFETEVLEVLR